MMHSNLRIKPGHVLIIPSKGIYILLLIKMGLGWPYLQDLRESPYPQWEARVVQSVYPKEYLNV